MAYRKIDEASLTAVAEAIRDRAGTADMIGFPDGFVSAVEGIPDYLMMKITNQTCAEYRNETLTALHQNALNGWSGLKGVYFPELVSIGNYALQGVGCMECDFPKVQTVGSNAFAWASDIQKVTFHCATEIAGSAFYYATNLAALIIRTDSVCTLGNANALGSTPIANGTGYIYVPAALVDSYKAATNWSIYAAQIRAIEDHPEVTGG